MGLALARAVAIRVRIVRDRGACERCPPLQKELEVARARIIEFEVENALLRAQLQEVLKLSELQKADLERYREAYEAARPNHPERVPKNELQLAFEQVLATLKPAVRVHAPARVLG